MISKTFNPTRRKDLLQRDLEDGCVLFAKEQLQVYTLNPTATLIWMYCDGTYSVEKIAKEIAAICNQEISEVLKDVQKTVTDLQDKGLLKE